MSSPSQEPLPASSLSEIEALQLQVEELQRELRAARALAGEAQSIAATLSLVKKYLPVSVWSTDGDLRFIPSASAGMKGLPPTDASALGISLYQYFGTTDPDFIPLRAAHLALSGESVNYEHEWTGRWWHSNVGPVRDSTGRIVGTVGVALDVTEQKRAIEAKLLEEQRYRDLVENANDIVYTQDLKGNFTSMNRAAELVTGYSRAEALGMCSERILPPDQLDLARRMTQEKLTGASHTTYELTILNKHQEQVHLEVSSRLLYRDGRPVGVQGIARDISERRRLEEQLRQKQKMEAIGVLAGGIAHDFNNLLTGILGYTDLLKVGTQPGEKLYESLDVIQKAAEQAARLTSQLLGFARRGKHQNIAVKIHDLLREVIGLLSRTIDKRIVIDAMLADEDVCVMGDPTQLHQVFLNLGINAKEAMETGGLLLFRTEIVESPSGEAQKETGALPSRFLVVTIADTGSGIPEEIQSRIFEPFFTTKESGTGMGLAMVYGIIKNHSGFVRMESRTDEGSRFSVYLPLLTPDSAEETEQPALAIKPGHGRILLVDDESLVRNVVAIMLTDLGYEVVTRADGEEAIEYYCQHFREVDLVIMDMIMPKISGKQLFEAMRKVNPEIRALLSSGYGRDGAAQEILDLGMAGFIQKPYQMQSLGDAVARALEMQVRPR